ncbi:MAG: endonuclease/exonuclease/phosphatase family protein, partial [Flavobacteriales bacterium]
MAEKQPGKSKSFLGSAIRLLMGLSCAIALLTSLSAQWIPPDVIMFPALFGIAFPVIFLLNVCALLLFFITASRWRWIQLVLLVLSMPVALRYCHFNFTEKQDDFPIRVMTFNTHMMGYYDKSGHDGIRASILKLIKEEDCQIICLQEFFHSDKKGHFPTTDSIRSIYPDIQTHMRYTHALSQKRFFGIVIFSRYPIIATGEIPYENETGNHCIWADVLLGKDTLRVINAHLQSIYLQPEDYAVVEGETQPDELDDAGKRIGKRLASAFVKRADQARRIHDHMDACPHPVLVCGDFNDTPSSFAYHEIRGNLQDAFLESGNGIGATYNG